MVQLPVLMPVTVLPDTVQIPGVVDEKVTALPDAPTVAMIDPEPPTTTVGAVPKLLLCDPGAMVMVCVAWAAAV
jgi:hypothetical protein